MTAVQCSYAELLAEREPGTLLREGPEPAGEDDTPAFATSSYRRYRLFGIDWERALLLAVELDAAA